MNLKVVSKLFAAVAKELVLKFRMNVLEGTADDQVSSAKNYRIFFFSQIILDEDKKFFKLLELLGIYQEQGSVLVFVDKQEHADELMTSLMKHSYPCMSLHGGIDQYDRDSTIVDFKKNNIKLLVSCFIFLISAKESNC